MKTIFIGDSHAPGMKNTVSMSIVKNVDFFACGSSIGVNMSLLDVKGMNLVPSINALKEHFKKTTNKTEIDLHDVDTVVLIGLRMEFPYKLLEITNYSRQVVNQSMFDIIKNQSISIKLAEKIRNISDEINIIVVPNPLITEHLKSHIISTSPGIIPITSFGKIVQYPDDILLRWKVAVEQAFNHMNVHFCFQNEKTIIDHIYTQKHFALDASTTPGIRHMNDKFWEYIWRDLNNIISKLETF